jgi:hypothetical protein
MMSHSSEELLPSGKKNFDKEKQCNETECFRFDIPHHGGCMSCVRNVMALEEDARGDWFIKASRKFGY